MRFIAQLFLVLIFTVLFFTALLAGTVKFQLLNYKFWQTAFDQHNVYQSLAENGKDSLNAQLVKAGGSKNDAKVLTDLVTTDNVKDVITKNLQNTLSFANGKESQLMVYVPIEKVPRNILPKNLTGVSSEMPVKDLLTKFNYQNYNDLPLASLSHSGESASLVLTGAVALLTASVILLIFSVNKGGRLVAPGVAFVISGGLTLLVTKIVDSLTIVLNTTLAGTVLSPVLGEMTRVWLIVGGTALILGIVLFFVRKGSYNKKIA